MIQADWTVFEVNARNNPQAFFELLCYLLFCRKYSKPEGLFRFKDQAGIETDPVEVDEAIVGWQAKYYKGSMSAYKSDLIKMINTTLSIHPGVTDIEVYTNTEWGQGRDGGKPAAMKAIEAHALANNVTVHWKTKSFFESEFVTVENEHISSFFFSLTTRPLQDVTEKHMHTKQLLQAIKNTIIFQGSSISIDRQSERERIEAFLEEEDSSPLLIHGGGGVGKTSVIKSVYEHLQAGTHLFMIKAAEIAVSSVDLLFPMSSFKSFLGVFEESDKKVFVIDSAEKLLDFDDFTVVDLLIGGLIQKKWKIIFTTRNNYLEDLKFNIERFFSRMSVLLPVLPLTERQLKEVAQKESFEVAEDSILRALTCIPFYLQMYLQYYDTAQSLNYQGFKQAVWKRAIEKGSLSRGARFVELVFNRTIKNQFYLEIATLDERLLKALRADDIIGLDKTGTFVAHDIYEEWALEKKVDQVYASMNCPGAFFEEIGHTVAIRKAFKVWLEERLVTSSADTVAFIESSIYDAEVPKIWRDEIVVVVIQSDYGSVFFETFKRLLLQKDSPLLLSILFVLRTACKGVDYSILHDVILDKSLYETMSYVPTRPVGKGWNNVITFLTRVADKLTKEQFSIAFPVLKEWNDTYKGGETTQLATRLALRYYELVADNFRYEGWHDPRKDALIKTISDGADEVKPELKSWVRNAVDCIRAGKHSPYLPIIKRAVSDPITHIGLINSFPDEFLEVLPLLWIKAQSKDEDPLGNSYFDEQLSRSLGINDENSYSPGSAYRGPILFLLKQREEATIAFIKWFANHVAEQYAGGRYGADLEKIELITGGSRIEQYANDILWTAYRGNHLLPNVFTSMLMALEHYLLDIGKTSPDRLSELLNQLLQKSKSAALTGVVCSLVVAYPYKTDEVGLRLMRSRNILQYDLNRLASERTGNFTAYDFFGQNSIHHRARKLSNELASRHEHLEHIVFRLQLQIGGGETHELFNERRLAIWEILDSHFEALKDLPPGDDRNNWRIQLGRMDFRSMKHEAVEVDGGFQIHFEADIPDDVKAASQQMAESINDSMRYTSLYLWATSKFKNEPPRDEFKQFDSDVDEVIKQMREIASAPGDTYSIFRFREVSTLGICASVLVRDFFEMLREKDKDFVSGQILDFVKRPFDDNYLYQIDDGTGEALIVLPLLIDYYTELTEVIFRNVTVLSLSSDSVGHGELFSVFSIWGVRQYLFEKHPELARKVLLFHIKLLSRYAHHREKLRTESHENRNYNWSKKQLLLRLIDDCDTLRNENYYEVELPQLLTLPECYRIILLLNPRKLDEDQAKIADKVIAVIAELMSSGERRIGTYLMKTLEALARFLLNVPNEHIKRFVSPLVVSFGPYESFQHFFEAVIKAEDHNEESFWTIWELFEDSVINIINLHPKGYDTEKVVTGYLFNSIPWKSDVENWHVLTTSEKPFFRRFAHKAGYSVPVITSYAKMAIGIGTEYRFDAVTWITSMISKSNETPYVVIKGLIDRAQFIPVPLPPVYLVRFSITISQRLDNTAPRKKYSFSTVAISQNVEVFL